jgi:hypothetical protein
LDVYYQVHHLALVLAFIGFTWVLGFVDIHIGVGFGVARSDYSGDARASVRGTSNRLTPTLLFYISATIMFNTMLGSLMEN